MAVRIRELRARPHRERRLHAIPTDVYGEVVSSMYNADRAGIPMDKTE